MYTGGKDMKHVNVRKLALAGILVAVGIVCSPLSIPVGASKCAPVQHFINILGGVFLGPGYAVGMAFVTSLLRNLMGTGTLLAFPGSMCGAFLCGMLYKYGKHLPFAYAGELFGTSVIGGLLSYPIATLIMGSESAVFGFVIPFFVSSCGGTIIAAVLVTAMKKMKVFDIFAERNNSSARAIRKDALPCLPRRCRFFAHKRALGSSANQSPDLYASIDPPPDVRWLNITSSARAIRKDALPCLLRRCRFFAH